MLNISAFIIRLEEIMQNNQLNAAAFAERIGVQRSSVSHILSKRNKPSLEFILKVYNAFDEVELDWLLFGNSDNQGISPLSAMAKQPKIPMGNDTEEPSQNQLKQARIENSSEIVQIIQLYKDGSFHVYFPKS